jgi:hypothetical protein
MFLQHIQQQYRSRGLHQPNFLKVKMEDLQIVKVPLTHVDKAKKKQELRKEKEAYHYLWSRGE